MNVNDYLEQPPTIVGLPPLGSFDLGNTSAPGRRMKPPKHGGSLDMLKLATRNATTSKSFDNLCALSKSPRKVAPGTPCPGTPSFEILLKNPSESDLLLHDDTHCGTDKDELESRRRSGECSVSRGSSFDFDSGVSSLTEVSMSSVRSVIQLSHSTTIKGWTAAELEEVQARLGTSSSELADTEDRVVDEAPIRWNLSSLPSKVLHSVRRRRADSDSDLVPKSNSLSFIFFRRNPSRIFPDPDENANNQDDDILSDTEVSARKNGPRLQARHSA